MSDRVPRSAEGPVLVEHTSSSGKDGASRAPRPITWRQVALEAEILAALATAPEAHETVALAFARKERELVALFGRLTVLDAMELHRRLSLDLHDDPIALGFRRLVVDRRVRLLSYLAGARRREAIRNAG